MHVFMIEIQDSSVRYIYEEKSPLYIDFQQAMQLLTSLMINCQYSYLSSRQVILLIILFHLDPCKHKGVVLTSLQRLLNIMDVRWS